ncbi:MAG: hypothetical protein WA956_14990 [Stenotrophomonas sp.]
MSAASTLRQVLDDPSYRMAEEAMTRWLVAPDFHALDRELPTLGLDHVRKLGLTLEGAALLGLVPRSAALARAVGELARMANAGSGGTLQERWGLSSLPFDFDRLEQRLREASAMKRSRHCPPDPSPAGGRSR